MYQNKRWQAKTGRKTGHPGSTKGLLVFDQTGHLRNLISTAWGIFFHAMGDSVTAGAKLEPHPISFLSTNPAAQCRLAASLQRLPRLRTSAAKELFELHFATIEALHGHQWITSGSPSRTHHSTPALGTRTGAKSDPFFHRCRFQNVQNVPNLRFGDQHHLHPLQTKTGPRDEDSSAPVSYEETMDSPPDSPVSTGMG